MINKNEDNSVYWAQDTYKVWVADEDGPREVECTLPKLPQGMTAEWGGGWGNFLSSDQVKTSVNEDGGLTTHIKLEL